MLALRFVGANPQVVVTGEDRQPGEVHALRGSDPAQWQTHVPRVARVAYRDLWPGIDMHVRGDADTLKYEFHVRAGARPADVRLAYDGAERLAIDDTGALAIETARGTLRDARPVAYQTIGDRRVPIESRFVVDGRSYGFAIGAYDAHHDLVIDPGIAYSTYLGGSSHETPYAVAADAASNAYVTGFTQSPNFPTTTGAFDRTGSASNSLDAFVTKLNASGALVYSTFLGGGNFEWGRDIAVDAAGNAYIAGQTKSSDFPTTSNAFDRSFNVDTCPRCGIDQYDTFVTKLNATGSAVVYSTFLGGAFVEFPSDVAVNAAGQAFVTGVTRSADFPVTVGAFDTTQNGLFDVYVTKLNAAGSGLVYSTFLGGADFDSAGGIRVDADGSAYVVGSTSSADFPTTPGAYDRTLNNGDAFVTKLDPNGITLVFSTLIGGSGFESGAGVVLDGTGAVWIAGGTDSPDFPTPGASDDPTFNGGGDAYLAQLDGTGSALLYGSFLGGTAADGASDLALDGAGNIVVVGQTMSTDFPTTAGAHDRVFNGDPMIFWADGFVTTFVFGTAPPPPPPPPPPPSGPLPAPTLNLPANDARISSTLIFFDWSDVAGATSYTIQIDDSQNPSAPFIREQTVTGSEVTFDALPARRMWWRVRANAANGTPGAWSSVRRFEIR